MVTEVKEKRIITEKEARAEFDGQWVLLDERNFHPSECIGYLVAYGNGTPEDRDALNELLMEKYSGGGFLMKGYIPREDIVLGVYDC